MPLRLDVLPRRVTARLFVAAASVLLAPAALSQAYPSHPVKIVVPFAPGGSADVYGRFIAQRLQESMGRNFVVENKPGAGSIMGTDLVAKSAPDGHTLLLMSNTHTVNLRTAVARQQPPGKSVLALVWCDLADSPDG